LGNSGIGKTPKPLTILVAQEWLTHEQVQTLADQGHVIQVAPVADLILSPAAHFWRDDMWEFLAVALKAARARKKETNRVDIGGFN
jgi:hypothetical protein